MIDSTRRTGLTNDRIERESSAVAAKKSIYYDEDDSDVSIRRKAYPQRPNRTKLNYRDLERGMFEQIRQTEWSNTITPLSSGKKEILSSPSPVKQNISPISETRCAMYTCENLVKLGSAYCSKICIRHHVNERLQSFANGKSLDDELFVLRDVQTKKSFEKKFSTKTDDLYRWLIEHRSHVIINSSPTNDKTTEIRCKVPKALYEKLLFRSEKFGESFVKKEEIEKIVNEIEEEMFRVYKRIDNSYKNKFRSLLANISNTNNNFFYREILSRRWTAEEIVSMKAEDMLPPEEKEKRKDEFHREVQMIIQGEVSIPSTKPIVTDSRRSEPEENDQTKIIELSTVPTTSAIGVTGQAALSSIDAENDYIEPESPTGADALIYDDADENEENSSSTTTSPSQSPIVSSNREDYNPSKIINSTCSTSVVPQWRGIITLTSDLTLHCRSTKIYGENEYLLEHLPKQMNVLGRLRVIDLWHYVRDSITIRDILILTIVSSTSNMKDDQMFSEYFHSMRNAHRAAVMTKQFDSSMIRDLYILPAETIDCPNIVSSTFALPKLFESNQFFLIVIGSTKRFNENETTNSFVYKPIVLQDVSISRDPRLSKSRDDLQKLIDETFVKIRQASSIDAMQPIISSLLQILKERQREDLELKFTEELHRILSEWQTQSTVTGDNLTEENMEVDEEEGDKRDTLKVVVLEQPRRERKRKSRFSDIVPNPQDRTRSLPFTSDVQISTNSSINRIRSSRFSFANEPPRQLKFNRFQCDQFTEQIKSHGFVNFSFEKNQWMNATFSRIPLRSEATVNLLIEQRKFQSRISSTNKETRLNSSTDYYDFDRPEE